MIEIADLWKSFGALPVLQGVSLRVERGSVVAIIGPSGSGKSTLLRCVNLLEDPDRGRIRVGDREMRFDTGLRGKHSDRELSAFRAATGMVFQHFNLFPHMTVIGNVMTGPSIVKGMPRHEAAEIARAARQSRARRQGRLLSLATLGRTAAARRGCPRPGDEPSRHVVG